MNTSKTLVFVCFFLCFHNVLNAQFSSIQGKLHASDGEAVTFANVILYDALDSSLYKVTASDDSGFFHLQDLNPGKYYLNTKYIGLQDYEKSEISLESGQNLDLGKIILSNSPVLLRETTVSTKRSILEVKPDRLIFNVEGTINSIGSDAISLLRKAPGVTVDNNDNISLLGRSGVLLYIDGKRIPLSGQDLSNYLQNLNADQIDRIEIITNPGARYEAEGNAGIIDIRLKKEKNLGTNGSVNANYIQGKYPKSSITSNGNYKNRKLNLYGTLGFGQWKGFQVMEFESFQNSLYLEEDNTNRNKRDNLNYRIGTDYFLSNKQTLGFLYSGNVTDGSNFGINRIDIAKEITPKSFDSILIANTYSKSPRDNQSFNLNYRFDDGDGQNLNIDMDYAFYRNQNDRNQINQYYDPSGSQQLTEFINYFDTPTDIDIWTLKLDYDHKGLGGKLSYGTKLSKVITDNVYLVYDGLKEPQYLNKQRSNSFKYDENVYAAYVNFTRNINKSWSFNAGLRAEQTDAKGHLHPFLEQLQEPPVILNYLSWFPSFSLNWNIKEGQSMSFNYGRRINRPDYNVLNPFNNQLSQLSFEKGNPFLRPEIVNNLEIGYTLASRYNFKLGYSLTADQITRLIGPDDKDPRASYINWDNLAKQTEWSFNASVPVQIFKNWNTYFNIGASHIDNQADYGGGAVVDLQAFTYNIYQQHSFELPHGFNAEISGYYSGPGIWGGVFVYESSWSIDIGLQRKFFQEKLNAKLSASDLFYSSGWDGYSVFNGLESYGRGRWDSQRLSLNLSYRFGNDQIKMRKRNSGLEDEAKRVGE